MKALVFSAIREVTMQEVADPVVAPHQTLIKIGCTGICGSDLTGFMGHSPRRQPGLILGHETIGVAVQVPEGNYDYKVGDRVVVNPTHVCGKCANCVAGRSNICINGSLIGMDRVHGAFAEYVAVSATNVFKVKDGVPDAQAMMVEPLANGVHLFGLIEKAQFGTLAIYGAGTQGILMLALAQLLGYRDIAMVDVNADRLRVAKEYGATLLINPKETDPAVALKDWTGGVGVDVGIDAAGITATRASLIYAVRKGGQIMLLGNHDVLSEVDLTLVVRSEQRLQGCFCYTPQDFATSKKLLENGDIDIQKYTETYPLEDGQASFDKLVKAPGDTLKIVLTP